MLKKRFGQHFLNDRNIIQRIVRCSQLHLQDTIVEIGPGAGALTRELAAAARHVVAVEIDRDLIAGLRESMPENVDVVEADALEIDFERISSVPFRLVANLPYNVATPLLKRFIEFRRRIIDVTVMIQREVAERITANAGDDAYGPLSLLIQYYATPALCFVVPAGAFRPKPKVDSAVIRLAWRDVPDAHDFTDFVHGAFASRRKKLVNNLLHIYPHLKREDTIERVRGAGIAESARPEELSLEDYLRLYASWLKT
jgi:16S rRNA (adenine1518-N6/adenine1519-N6)-dimethyltransferase